MINANVLNNSNIDANNIRMPFINKDNSLNNFLNLHRCERDSTYYNFVGLDGVKGKFIIERAYIEDFWNLYDINEYSSIGEKRDPYSSLTFDFDIKKDNENSVFYTDGDVKRTIDIINKQLSHNIKDIQPEQYYCVLLEKDAYYSDKDKKWKKGFHLHYYNLFLLNKDVKNILIKAIQPTIEFDIDDIYSNAWLLYGSYKNQKSGTYKISKIFNQELNEMDIEKTLLLSKIYNNDEEEIIITKENLNKNIPRILSLTPYNRPTNDFIKHNIIERPLKPSNLDKDENDIEITPDVLKDIKFLVSLIKTLDVDNRQDWWKMGSIIFNSSKGCDEGLEIWNEWSSKSSKYDPASNDIEWSKYKLGHYTIKSLYFYAKQDNFNEYCEFIKSKKKASLEKEVFLKDISGEAYNDFKYIISIKSVNHKSVSDIISKVFNGKLYYNSKFGWIVYNDKTGIWNNRINNELIAGKIMRFLALLMDNYFSGDDLKNYKDNIQNQIDELNLDIDNKDKSSTYISKCKKEKKQLENSLKSNDQSLLKYENEYFKNIDFCSKVVKALISDYQIQITDIDYERQFENRPELLAFNDYVYNLYTGKLENFNQDMKLIQKMSYDFPDKDEYSMKLVYDLLITIFNTNEKVDEFINIISLSLFGCNKNEKIFFHLGVGRNGKGLLHCLIEVVLNIYFQVVSTNIFCKKETDYNAGDFSEIKNFQYSRYLSFTEPDTDDKFKTSILKKISGNDKISCKSMGKDKISFVPKCTPNGQLNEMLNLTSKDEAVAKRIEIVQYPNVFVENPTLDYERKIDFDLKRKVSDDVRYRNGFLHLLLDSYSKTKGIYTPSQDTVNITAQYLTEQNPLYEWFNRYYEKDDQNSISTSELYNHYTVNSEKSVSQTKFGTFMKELCKRKKTNTNIQYLCVKKTLLNQQVSCAGDLM
jgi:P4 family phage/plasmid primase-like protien